MTAVCIPWAADILHLWFHRLRPAQWFGRSDAVDALLAMRFGKRLRAFSHRPAKDFLRDTATARAAILLFDQCPRNLYRGTPKAFATDPLARALCRAATRKGWDKRLSLHAAQFLLMPLMHSENRADQALSARKFTALGNASITRFARDHAAMVRRFGRFPHRNDVLGRNSTAAERKAVAAGHSW